MTGKYATAKADAKQHVVVDKSKITPAVVQRLLVAQFPEWADLPVTPVELDGWDNTTFRLGTDMSVRLPSGDAYVAQVDKEHQWLPVLAPQLPWPIPQPLAKGVPTDDFPRPWSVYRWLEGEPALPARIADLTRFATEVAAFLAALYRIDPTGGPRAGAHSHHRGMPLSVWDGLTRTAIADLAGKIDGDIVLAAWERTLLAPDDGPAVWVHGDIVGSNLLVANGALTAVLDFGCSAVGDPACDVAIAWTLLSGVSRAAFRAALGVDDATWERGRGWALWKALMEMHHGDERDEVAQMPGWQRMGWRTSADELVSELVTD